MLSCHKVNFYGDINVYASDQTDKTTGKTIRKMRSPIMLPKRSSGKGILHKHIMEDTSASLKQFGNGLHWRYLLSSPNSSTPNEELLGAWSNEPCHWLGLGHLLVHQWVWWVSLTLLHPGLGLTTRGLLARSRVLTKKTF